MLKKQNLLVRATGLVLAAVILAGCTGNQQPAQPPAQPATPAQNADAQPEPAGVEVDELLIGLLGPWTGNVAQFGIAKRNGAMLYINQFNERGGLQINTADFDEEGVPANAIAGYHWLVDQGITALIGSVTSAPTLAVVPVAFEDNMPMITATATHANVTVDAGTGNVWTNMFRSCFIDPFQGLKMAEFAVEVIGAQTAAVLYSNEIDYSIGLTEAFVARAQELGLEIVATEVFADAAVDFLGQLTNIAATNPDVLFIPAYFQHIALIGPQSVQAGLDTVMLGADGWNGTMEIIADPSSIEGSFFMTGFTDEDESPLVQGFLSDFMAAYGEVPNMFAAQGYDAAMILLAAIELALADGFLPNTDEFKASVISHMAATSIQGVTGHITFDEFNNPQKSAFILEVREGDARFWGTF
ncbi:MAG: ABC transporter substrate-binding protein [Defluviitaleaceae bacterium]|nr:ABC transporter substrate-binding protein [Defluviitaleaceae bacterium]